MKSDQYKLIYIAFKNNIILNKILIISTFELIDKKQTVLKLILLE